MPTSSGGSHTCRGRRFGIPRIRNRGIALRPAVAVRIGGRHDRAAHGPASGPRRDVGGGPARGGHRGSRARGARSRRRGRIGDRRGPSVAGAALNIDPARPRDGARPSDPGDSATDAGRAMGGASRIAARVRRTWWATSRFSHPPTIPPAPSRLFWRFPTSRGVSPGSPAALPPHGIAHAGGRSMSGADRAGAPLLYLTGSAAHFAGLRAIAAERGWTLDPDGLVKEPGLPPLAASRKRFMRRSTCRAYPRRSGTGRTITAAPQRDIACTDLARRHPRRPAHAHTMERWPRFDRSHGGNVRVASVRIPGDHRSLPALERASRNLSVDGVKRQGEEIAALRERYQRCDPPRLRGGHPVRRPSRLQGADPRRARYRAGFAARGRRGLGRTIAAPVPDGHASSDGHVHHAPDQPAGPVPARL